VKKLIMFKGLPGSGKDTVAKDLMEQFPSAYKRVNKDDLREMLDLGKWSGSNEKFVLKIRDLIIKEALKEGKHVLCTDTNLHSKHEIKLKEIAKEGSADFRIMDLTSVDIDTCIKRDLKREKSVGEKVIKDMYNRYLKPKKEVIYPFNSALDDCIICDLDGTLAKFGNKNPYERDFENDELNLSVWYTIYSIINRRNIEETDKGKLYLIILSGRSSKFKDVTIRWLKEKGVVYDFLHMREEGDVRKDCIIKKEMFDKYIRNTYNPILIFDDRNQTVNLWRSLGLTCFQVSDGDF